jgi:hypothetical protein
MVKIDVALRVARECPSAALLVQGLEAQLIACILVSKPRFHDLLLLIDRSFSVRAGYCLAISIPPLRM